MAQRQRPPGKRSVRRRTQAGQRVARRPRWRACAGESRASCLELPLALTVENDIKSAFVAIHHLSQACHPCLRPRSCSREIAASHSHKGGLHVSTSQAQKLGAAREPGFSALIRKSLLQNHPANKVLLITLSLQSLMSSTTVQTPQRPKMSSSASTTTIHAAQGSSSNNPLCEQLPKNALVLPATHQLQALLTIIRDKRTQR